MAIYLDRSVVQRLIEARLETANDSVGGVTLRVIHMGERDPDLTESSVWCRTASLKLVRSARRDTNQEPTAEFELVLGVSVSESDTAASVFANASAVQAVCQVLEAVTLDDIATSGHVVDILSIEDEDEQDGELHQLVGARITVRGICRRQAGSTIEEWH